MAHFTECCCNILQLQGIQQLELVLRHNHGSQLRVGQPLISDLGGETEKQRSGESLRTLQGNSLFQSLDPDTGIKRL